MRRLGAVLAASLSIGCGRIDYDQVFDAGSAPAGPAIVVSATAQAACAVTDDGSLWAWGEGAALGPIAGRVLVPTAIERGGGWSEVACAESLFGCGVRAGELRCWGANHLGQLGTGDMTDVPVPTTIVDVAGLTGVRARFDTACALAADGALYCWGRNIEGQLGQDDFFDAPDSPRPLRVGTGTFRSVSTGQGHTCAIASDGALYCWGRNSECELGLGDCVELQIRSPQRVGTANDWIAIEAGQDNTCGLRAPGTLYCWGDNFAGGLGLPEVREYAEPTLVDGALWTAISTNTFHTCGIQADASLHCWGRNEEGQLGLDVFDLVRMAPARVPGEPGWIAVSAGRFHTCAMRADGSAWCTGANDVGMLGNDMTERVASFTRVLFP